MGVINCSEAEIGLFYYTAHWQGVRLGGGGGGLWNFSPYPHSPSKDFNVMEYSLKTRGSLTTLISRGFLTSESLESLKCIMEWLAEVTVQLLAVFPVGHDLPRGGALWVCGDRRGTLRSGRESGQSNTVGSVLINITVLIAIIY